MISASLIGCGELRSSLITCPLSYLYSGILSLVQMSRLHLFGNYYLGTGLITVVGTSFATLSTANAVSLRLGFEMRSLTSVQIFGAMYADGSCPSTTSSDGTVTRGACPDAYGAVLGLSLLPFCFPVFNFLFRNIPRLLLPRNWDVFRQPTYPQANFPAPCHRNRHPPHRNFACWFIGYSQLGRRLERLCFPACRRVLPVMPEYRGAETASVCIFLVSGGEWLIRYGTDGDLPSSSVSASCPSSASCSRSCSARRS
jgi:hypothetical protein